MKMYRLFRCLLVLLFAGFCLSEPAISGQISPKNDKEEDDDEFVILPFEVSASLIRLGVTPGGAQDINYFRSLFEAGEMPPADAFTAEGLFSEHDLPLPGADLCEEVLCIGGGATEATIIALPDARYLAQIGFTSGMSAAGFTRHPLNLIAVVDKSGSMSGQPLGLVKDSLLEILAQLGAEDQLSIVLYGDRIDTVLPPTRATEGNKGRIRTVIHEIQSSGFTDMESGLKEGYALARRSAPAFEGTTRLMLFTDEQPNVGNTSAEGFMAQARGGAADNIGLTTIGVGVHFGAKLANQISSVRGGNLFFFPSYASMVERFKEDFELMVSEVAHNMVVRVRPEPGFRIVGIFGLPGDLVRWEGESILFEIETLFLSRNKGALYVAFAPSEAAAERELNGGTVAQASLSYVNSGSGERVSSQVELSVSEQSRNALGLQRGVLLVNEYASVQKALRLAYEENALPAAYQEIKQLDALFSVNADASLEEEVRLIKGLHQTLAYQVGEREAFLPGAPEALRALEGTWEVRKSDVSGEHRKMLDWLFDEDAGFLIHVWPVGYAAVLNATGTKRFFEMPLTFRDEMLVLPWEGEEVLFTVTQRKNRRTLLAKDAGLRIRLRPSKVHIEDYLVPHAAERDPVSGLPR